MADAKLSALTELDATPADADEVYIRDVSEEANAESKRITIANLLAGAGGGATLTVAETEAFASADAPNASWTDLNLSGIVGANHALVLIKVTNGEASVRAVYFRINGDAEPTLYQDEGCAAINNKASGIGYIIIATDTNGIVEWSGMASGQTTTLDVVAFIK